MVLNFSELKLPPPIMPSVCGLGGGGGGGGASGGGAAL